MRRLAGLGLLTLIAGCEVVGGSTGGTGGSGSGGTGGTPTGAGGQSGGHTNPLAQDVIDAFVAAHNQARSGPLTPPPSPALPPVSWDAILADSVYNYAIGCQGGRTACSATTPTARPTTRRWVAAVTSVRTSMAGAAAARRPTTPCRLWMSEASSYDYASGNIGNAGHYTQIVWRDSVRIGCAIVDCPALTYHNTVICDYAPGGNISGQKPY